MEATLSSDIVDADGVLELLLGLASMGGSEAVEGLVAGRLSNM